MARSISKRSKIINSLIAWTLGLIIFFPILWIIILSFKTEGDAIRSPIAVVISNWTFENYFVVQNRSDYFKHFYNCLLYTSPSPRDRQKSRMPSSA